jgi:NAD(P)H-dependent FMN reductase
LPWLPHFDVSASYSVVPSRLAQTGALLEQADAVLFCVTEYAEGLPVIVGNLLEWAIAGGFLAGKRVGWINVANGTTRAR